MWKIKRFGIILRFIKIALCFNVIYYFYLHSCGVISRQKLWGQQQCYHHFGDFRQYLVSQLFNDLVAVIRYQICPKYDNIEILPWIILFLYLGILVWWYFQSRANDKVPILWSNNAHMWQEKSFKASGTNTLLSWLKLSRMKRAPTAIPIFLFVHSTHRFHRFLQNHVGNLIIDGKYHSHHLGKKFVNTNR